MQSLLFLSSMRTSFLCTPAAPCAQHVERMSAAMGMAAFRSAAQTPHGVHGSTKSIAKCLRTCNKHRMRAERNSGAAGAVAAASAPEAGRPPNKSRGKPSVRRSMDGVMSSARAVAVQQLMRIEHEEAYAGRVAGRIKASVKGLDAQDKARDARFVKTVVAGVTRWLRRLDFVLDELTHHRLNQLDPVQHQILRLGTYELLELGAPSHIINEHVDLVKWLVYPEAAGLTNGVLRNVARMRDAGTLPTPALPSSAPTSLSPEQADALAISTSHPTWMVERWAERYGPAETLRLLQANNKEPAHGVRVCSPDLKADIPAFVQQLHEEGVQAAESKLLPREFVRVSGGLQQLLATYVTIKADCQVQDEAAGLVVALLDPRPGEAVLDACAAPGGKTLFAAARMKGKGRILALDRSERKLRALSAIAWQQNFGRMITTQVADFREFSGLAAAAEQPPAFDRVLLDVPCSGLGVLAKRADLRWRRLPEDFAELTQLQDELLEAAAPLVKPGGILVYSTCSIEPQENQHRVEKFLERHPDFSLQNPLTTRGLTMPPAAVTPDGYVLTLPHKDQVDGAFAARLQRAF